MIINTARQIIPNPQRFGERCNPNISTLFHPVFTNTECGHCLSKLDYHRYQTRSLAQSEKISVQSSISLSRGSPPEFLEFRFGITAIKLRNIITNFHQNSINHMFYYIFTNPIVLLLSYRFCTLSGKNVEAY